MKAVAAILMVASIYGGSQPGEIGARHVASKARYNPNGFTAASKTLPFGTVLSIRRYKWCVTVKVNDRGPYVRGRDLDLSLNAARYLHMVGIGVARVKATHGYSCPFPLPTRRPAKLIYRDITLPKPRPILVGNPAIDHG
jgi:rare lipoprotein A (peptidoglycan hydrolase)